MSPLEMIFSIFVLSVILGFFVLLWKKLRPKYVLSFLETGDPSLRSYRKSEKTKNRYFPHSSGVIDLKKHSELLRFKEVFGNKEYLVEPWKRDGNLYIQEGETKAVIFEFVKDDAENTIAIPCLRIIETIIEEKNNNPLLQYKDVYLGVLWEGKRKMINSENLFGIVKYEGIQD